MGSRPMSAVSDTVRSIGKAKIGAIAAAAFIMLAFFMVLTMRVWTGTMSPLYTGHSLKDSSKIVTELEKTGTPYELTSNGTEVLVPSDRVLHLRIDMAEQ